MASTLFLILDDLSTDFTYGGPRNWTVSSYPSWYGRTSTYPAFADAQMFGSFDVSFEGISIAFSGNTPDATLPQSITVSIDGGTAYNTSYMDPTPQTYLQWYQSPTLSGGKHTIHVDGVAGTSLDYATITVDQNTSLSGKKIIVDNDDPAVHYSGNWTRNTSKSVSGDISLKAFPFRNSTHRSTTPGDTITFLFSGTSVAVYGIFSWGNIGTLAATYTIDGGTPVAGSYPVTTRSTRYVSGTLEDWNFPFALFDSLSTGDHTLVINVTQCLNHTFIFDYITYTPSFSNLASMPTLVFTPPASTSTSPTSSQVFQNSAGSKHTPVGAIVGGVVGGLLALGFIPLLIFWLRRRKAKENLPSPVGVSQEEEPANWNAPPPAQLEAQTFTNAFHSPLDSPIVSPFQDEGSGTPTHLGLSTFADRKRVRNDNFSGATSGPFPLPSTARSMSDVASLSATNPTRVASPASDLSSMISVSSPPAYEAISAHQRSALPSQ